MTALIQLRPVASAIAARLVGVTNATGWVGEIGARNGLPGVTNTPDGPIAKSPDDPRVQPYFVLYPGIGTTAEETNLADTLVDVDIPIAITAAAGDIDDLLALVGRIDALLHRWAPGTDDGPGLGWFVYDLTLEVWKWSPTADGYAQARRILAGPLRRTPGYTPQVLPDRQVTPLRHFTRLEYVTTAHT